MSKQSQPIQALELANEIRLVRAAYKRDVKAGRCRIVDLIQSPPDELGRMSLGELLRAQKNWKHTRAQRFCSRLDISDRRKLGNLTERQRGVLAEALEHGIDEVLDNGSNGHIKRLPVAPFQDWLDHRLPAEGVCDWAWRHRISDRALRSIRRGETETVGVDVLNRVLGEAGLRIGDLYPEYDE